MRILLLAIGTRGDVQPFVALGRALSARGHEVALAAPKGFAAMCDGTGFGFFPLPADFQELMKQPEIQAALTSFSGKIKALRWASDLMNAQLSAIWDIGHDFRPQVILHHFKAELAPQLARELGGISIPVMLQPGFMPTGEYPQFLLAKRSHGRLFNRASFAAILPPIRLSTLMLERRWEKASGVKLGRRLDPMQGYAHGRPAPRIHAYSPTLVPRPADWPETEVQTGYFFTDPVDWTPPEGLVTFLAAGPPPIYVGFGSMPGVDAENTARAVLGALERTGLRAVIATGWGGIEALSPGPHIHVLEAAPHSWLFPRMAAVVHHGGSGTTHEGLRWGRPSVICPLFADQPFFGARVADLGAGPEPIRQKRLTADGLARALDFALTPGIAARAVALGEAIRGEDGIGKAIALVEAIG